MSKSSAGIHGIHGIFFLFGPKWIYFTLYGLLFVLELAVLELSSPLF